MSSKRDPSASASSKASASVAKAAHANAASSAKATVHYEFFGPPGALAIMIGLPVVIWFLYGACSTDACFSVWPSSPDFLRFHNPFANRSLALVAQSALTWRGASLFLGWFALQVVLYYVVPGRVVDGVVLDEKTKARLKYPLNGLASGVIGALLMIALALADVISPTIVYDEFLSLSTTAILFSFTLATYLYLSSLLTPHDTPYTQLAPHGNTGNAVYDFFIGRSLNPRVFGLDFKYFCELRPGLVGWVLINFSLAAQQYARIGTLTNSMVLVLVFQTLYVIDALVSEQAILTTMDITTDGFGFMLAFGDLAWVPFTYSLQARYLADHPLHLSYVHVALVLLVKATGLYIFRTANNEKNEFRTNPDSPWSRSCTFIQTERGTKLLTSGWWGRARHANYLGDLLMGLAWCLPCGFDHPITYFYFIYFAVLLVHRERRDDDKCRDKYKKDWVAYCKKVPYRIVPYVY